MNHPPDPEISTYKTIKTSLKSIVTDPYVIERLNSTVLMAHRISIHTLHFLKLYLLHTFEMSHQLPNVDHSLVLNIMKTLAPKQTLRGRPPNIETIELKVQLQAFYLEYYQPLMALAEPLSEMTRLNYEHMGTILEYMTTNVQTVYLNNIKQHFITCVERYINVISQKKSKLLAIKNSSLSSIQKKDQTTELCRILRDLKTDILSLNSKLISSPAYHEFISQTRAAILPNKSCYDHNSVYYDLQCHPEQYLLGMFKMIREIEAKDASIMNLFPLRTSIVPKYIKIDTTSLVSLLMDPQRHGLTKSHCISKGNLVKLQDHIWKFFFKTQKKCFYNHDKYKYRFNYMIETDGIGCSVQLIRQDLFGRRYIRQTNSLSISEKYINEVPLEVLQGKKLVAIDPNLSDLLYCITETQNQTVKLRYTQNQRRKETKAKKYMRLIEHFKNNTLIEGKTIAQWEAQLSYHNHKTLVMEKFQNYVKQKNLIITKLLSFYEGFLYRKLRLNGYINRQKSEARFLNRFKKIFGAPENIVIGIGDYEQHQHRKYKEPIKGKGFRQMFRKAGYKHTYLVDEHKTSCKCYHCGDIVKDNEIVGGGCITFRRCKNPRPWRKQETIVRHGLLMCQTCRKLWCRDTNASLNIWKIMKAAQEARERPRYLQRGKVSISGTTSVVILKTFKCDISTNQTNIQ